MEIITIESRAYKEIIKRLDKITRFVKIYSNDDEWVDEYEICQYLKVSKRTLQRLRKEQMLNYSKATGKPRYKISEVRRMLNEGLVRCNPDNLQILIDNFNKNA
ncbi:MAG: helix-turn-helix domain-containing protein [Dysgonamonadaceae bacterium]|jgi:hypothetical protein|nr:helix-turn-helix domain-containing protein [Dysgonamonadaceae bacterium]